MKTFWNLHSKISLWKKLVKNDHTWARVVVVDDELWWQYEILKGNISEENNHNMENKLEKSFSLNSHLVFKHHLFEIICTISFVPNTKSHNFDHMMKWHYRSWLISTFENTHCNNNCCLHYMMNIITRQLKFCMTWKGVTKDFITSLDIKCLQGLISSNQFLALTKSNFHLKIWLKWWI
jgi:hypothetical protein